MDLVPPLITTAFVVKVGKDTIHSVPAEQALEWLAQALADNGGDVEQAKAAFLAALNRLRRYT